MNTTDLVHYSSTARRPVPAAVRPQVPLSYQELATPLRCGILRARQFLSRTRRNDGSWMGQTFGDASLASQLVLFLAYLGEAESELTAQAARAVLDQQLPTGGWSRTPGGPADLSTSVQAYFALKLTGHNPSDAGLARARNMIRSLGGADLVDATTRFLLAALGQISYDGCPVIAPEFLFFNSQRSSEITPLAILWALRPVREVGIARGVRELFVNQPNRWPPVSIGEPIQSASRSARLPAALVTRCERLGWLPFRRRALDAVERRLLTSTAPMAIVDLTFQELVFTMLALDALGHGTNSRPFIACHDRVADLIVIDDTDRAWPQPHTDPLTDTALAIASLHASGVPLRQIIGTRTAKWLAKYQRDRDGLNTLATAWLLDSVRRAAGNAEGRDASLPPNLQVGDDEVPSSMPVRISAFEQRAGTIAGPLADALIQRQNSDGGWGPRDGIGATSAPDVTGAVLQALAVHANPQPRMSMDRGVRYLRASQRADGSWTSATGVHYVHGTSLAICGLIAAGVSRDDEAVEGGLNWLLIHQEASGGWGESIMPADTGSFDEYAFALATATQTAWSLRALVSAGRALDEPARRAVQFLLETQEDGGRWYEPHFVIRDAPTGRSYRNELHSVAWPLMALSEWAVAASAADASQAHRFSLRLVGVDA